MPRDLGLLFASDRRNHRGAEMLCPGAQQLADASCRRMHEHGLALLDRMDLALELHAVNPLSRIDAAETSSSWSGSTMARSADRTRVSA
jgi:hypothetical protein